MATTEQRLTETLATQIRDVMDEEGFEPCEIDLHSMSIELRPGDYNLAMRIRSALIRRRYNAELNGASRIVVW